MIPWTITWDGLRSLPRPTVRAYFHRYHRLELEHSGAALWLHVLALGKAPKWGRPPFVPVDVSPDEAWAHHLEHRAMARHWGDLRYMAWNVWIFDPYGGPKRQPEVAP